MQRPLKPAHRLALMEAENGGENHPHGDPLHPCAGVEDIPRLKIGHRLRRQGCDQIAERLEPFAVERRRKQPAALPMLGGRQQNDRLLAKHLRQRIDPLIPFKMLIRC